MSTPDDDLQAMLADLKSQFLLRTREQAADMLRACDALDASRALATQAAAGDLVRHWHRIAGSAGSFGMTEVSVSARAHERALETDTENAAGDPAQRQQLIDDMRSLARELLKP